MDGSTQKIKHTQVLRPRRCVGCGCEHPKSGLIRVVRSSDGTVALDITGKAPGRGAYICADIECVRLAKKRNALSRVMKQKVSPEIYTQVEEFCIERIKSSEQ